MNYKILICKWPGTFCILILHESFSSILQVQTEEYVWCNFFLEHEIDFLCSKLKLQKKVIFYVKHDYILSLFFKCKNNHQKRIKLPLLNFISLNFFIHILIKARCIILKKKKKKRKHVRYLSWNLLS